MNWESMLEKGFYFIGDTAYGLRSFLLSPFNDTMHGSAEDNYNFFHSSSRISIECAFGEINLRWGIFWSALKYPLKINCKIIDVCMRTRTSVHQLIALFLTMTVDDFLLLILFWTTLEYVVAKMMSRGMNKERYLVADEVRGLKLVPLSMT